MRKPDPRLIELDITEEIIENAKRQNSSACVIADAIKAQVPGATRVSVDLQTIRFTDTKRGKRYCYLTSESAQVALFAFDRGVTPPPMRLRLGRPLRIVTISARLSGNKARAARLELLEKKETDGTITNTERRSLKIMRATPVRPTCGGPVRIGDHGVVFGGNALPPKGIKVSDGKRQPQPRALLPSNARVFGARVANPSMLDDLLEQARDQVRKELDENDGT